MVHSRPQIAEQLLGKILTDLDNTKAESLRTAAEEGSAGGMTVEASREAHKSWRPLYEEGAIEPPAYLRPMSQAHAQEQQEPEGHSDSEVRRRRARAGGVAAVCCLSFAPFCPLLFGLICCLSFVLLCPLRFGLICFALISVMREMHATQLFARLSCCRVIRQVATALALCMAHGCSPPTAGLGRR